MAPHALGAGLATLPLLKGSGSGLFAPLGEGSTKNRGSLRWARLDTLDVEYTKLHRRTKTRGYEISKERLDGEFALRTSGQSFALFSLERARVDQEYTTTYIPGTTLSGSPANFRKTKYTRKKIISSVGYHFALSDSNFGVVELKKYDEKYQSTRRTTPEIAAQRRDITASLLWSRAMIGFSTALGEQLRIGGRLRTAGDAVVKKGTSTITADAGRQTTVSLGWQRPRGSAEVRLVQTAENKTAEARARTSVVLSGEFLLWAAEKANSLTLSRINTTAAKLVTPSFTYDAYAFVRTNILYTRRLKSLEDSHLAFGLVRGKTKYDRKSTATDFTKIVEWEWVSKGQGCAPSAGYRTLWWECEGKAL